MKYLLLSKILSAGLFFFMPIANANATAPMGQQDSVDEYAQMVFKDYNTAYEDALKLQDTVENFLADPTEKNIEKAKKAWLVSRNSYGITEAFRFYEGPIDFADAEGNEGPEGRLNAWPLDEAYIDYVQGNPKAGLVNNPGLKITKESLTDKN